MRATEIEADPHGSAASGSSAPGSSAPTMLTLSPVDIKQIFEASQHKIGKFFLNESDKRWEKKAADLLDQHDKRMTQRLAAVEQEFTRIMDQRIETPPKEIDRRMEELLGQAKTAAAEAAEALAQVRGSGDNNTGGGVGGGGGGRAGPVARYFSTATTSGPLQSDYHGYQVWVPKTMEIKGICEYGQRFSSGVSSEFADTFLEQVHKQLLESAVGIDRFRTRTSNRFSFSFKLVLVLNDRPEDMSQKDELRNLRDHAGAVLKDSDIKINGAACFAALQAAPWRRELYAVAGKMIGAFMALAGQLVAETRREYTKSGATLIYRLATSKADDKNAAVLKGSSPTTTPWRRRGS